MQNLTDQYLVQRVVHFQDHGAFVELHKRHYPKIHLFIRSRVSQREEAEDLASQVFMKVWEYLIGKAGGTVWHVRGLLYRIARNEVADFYRLQGRAPHPISIDDQGDPIEIVDLRQDPLLKQLYASDEAMLIDCVQKLKEGYREAVALRFFEELSIKEIAEIMEKSSGNVRVLIHRGLQALRPLLQKYQAEYHPKNL